MTPAPHPRPRRFAAVATIAALLALAAIALWLRHSWVGFEGNESLSRADIERIGQFRFPPSATGVAANYIGMHDSTLRVRFTLSPGDLETFLAGAKLPTPLSSASIPEDITNPGPPPKWWTPGRPAAFAAAEVTTPRDGRLPAVHKAVLIDESNPRVYTVWLVAYHPIIATGQPSTPSSMPSASPAAKRS